MKTHRWTFYAAMVAAAASLGARAQTAAPVPSLTIKPYGYIKFDAAYDSSRTSVGDLAFYVLPYNAGQKDAEMNLSVRDTRIGLQFTGPETDRFVTTARLEGDFVGGGSASSPNPRLRLAYLDVVCKRTGLQVRAGQDWDTFIVVHPQTPDLAILGQAGHLYGRRPQLRFTYPVKMGERTSFTARFAVARAIGEGANGDLDGGGQDDGADATTPNLQGGFVLDVPLLVSDKPAKFGVTGHWGRETLDTTVSNRVTAVDTTKYTTWSLIGSAQVPLTHSVTLSGTIWRGENLDSYLGGVGQGVNRALSTEIAARGGWAQMLVQASAALTLGAGYGVDDPDDDDLAAGGRARNERLFANLFYQLTPAVTLAAEYSRMTTDYKGGTEAEADRIHGSMIYRF